MLSWKEFDEVMFAKKPKKEKCECCCHEMKGNALISCSCSCFGGNPHYIGTIPRTHEPVIYEPKPKTSISHGKVVHPVGQPCKVCDDMRKTFEEDLASGKVSNILGEETDVEILDFLKKHGYPNIASLMVNLDPWEGIEFEPKPD